MLQDSDVGQLFAQMQAAYGHQWAHKADAIPLWKRALGGYAPNDVLAAVPKAVKTYVDFPPSLGQFSDMVQYNTPMLPGKTQENLALADRVYAYTMPQDAKKNPKGNPHGVKLPESLAQRVPGESAEDYNVRIANEVTFAMYPNLRARHG